MDTTQTLNKKHKLRKWHILLLLVLGMCCAMILRGIYNDIRRRHIQKDFLQTVADIYADAPGTLQPNYIADGWCYFLVEEEHAVYRIAEGAETPELVISNASGCITVTEDGVLFLRPRNIYLGEILWRVQYDLFRWKDGRETLLWEDSRIHGTDSSMAVVGDYLVYCRGVFSHAVYYRCLHGNRLGPENWLFDTENTFRLRDILWLDGNSIWYAVKTDRETVEQIIEADYYDFAVKDVIRLDLSSGQKTQIPLHMKLSARLNGATQRLYGIQDGKLIFQQLENDRLMAYDFAAGESAPALEEIDEAYPDCPIYCYRASTGECYLSVDTENAQVTWDLSAGKPIVPQEMQVQTVFDGKMILYNIREDRSRYERYRGIAIYRETGGKLWAPRRELYFDVIG